MKDRQQRSFSYRATESTACALESVESFTQYRRLGNLCFPEGLVQLTIPLLQ